MLNSFKPRFPFSILIHSRTDTSGVANAKFEPEFEPEGPFHHVSTRFDGLIGSPFSLAQKKPLAFCAGAAILHPLANGRGSTTAALDGQASRSTGNQLAQG